MITRLRKRRTRLDIDPYFTSDYIAVLKTLSRKHRIDDAEEIKRSLNLLKSLSRDTAIAGRGDIWIPEPNSRSGYYPILEKIPQDKIRKAIRKNTKNVNRRRAWDAVASSAESFLPLRASRPGQEMERSLLPAALISLPLVKGRHPALLGKRVPGDLKMSRIGGSRSVIPIASIDPGEWAKGGFGPLTFAFKHRTFQEYALGQRIGSFVKAAKQRRSGSALARIKPMRVKVRRVARPADGRDEILREALGNFREAKISRVTNVIAATQLASAPLAVLIGRKRKFQERIGEKKPIGVGGALWRTGLGGIPWIVGRRTAAQGPLSKAWVRRKAVIKKRKAVQNFSAQEKAHYYAGFKSGMRRLGWHRKSMSKKLRNWLLAASVPVAGAVGMTVMEIMHQEFGIPPTTVNMRPVMRSSMRKEYQPYPNRQLKALQADLESRLSVESNMDMQDELRKQIARLGLELEIRKSL